MDYSDAWLKVFCSINFLYGGIILLPLFLFALPDPYSDFPLSQRLTLGFLLIGVVLTTVGSILIWLHRARAIFIGIVGYHTVISITYLLVLGLKRAEPLGTLSFIGFQTGIIMMGLKGRSALETRPADQE